MCLYKGQDVRSDAFTYGYKIMRRIQHRNWRGKVIKTTWRTLVYPREFNGKQWYKSSRPGFHLFRSITEAKNSVWGGRLRSPGIKLVQVEVGGCFKIDIGLKNPHALGRDNSGQFTAQFIKIVGEVY